MNKNFFRCMFTIFMFCGIFMLFNIKDVSASYISSDINGIEESKYRGYKTIIQQLKIKHPNWTIRLFYTGLDWDYAVESERSGHGTSPKSLVQNTYDSAWFCAEAECINKLYDVSQNWNCASKSAIAYTMDPRNWLNESYIFQFQNLDSSSGEKSEIQKMTKNTFLDNSSLQDAVIQAAKTYNVSPFHLVSRILQEQGNNGTGKMNGYAYKLDNGQTVIVYNLFNIGVSGNSEKGFENGAKRAYQEGWFTREASLIGGAKFLRVNYIDAGQTTLYYQKFNVVNKNSLFAHQYMQNIEAAKNEGYKIYKTYSQSGVIDSHFEFIIPVYENMPNAVSPEPTTIIVQDVKIEKEEYNIIVDEALDLPYTYSPSNSTNAKFEWSSSNPEILRVWNNRFRGLKPGTAYVIIRTTDGKFEKRIKVTIKEILVTDINLKQNEYNIVVNEAVDIPYTFTPSNATNAKFIWSSSNPEILRVWNNRFRGLKAGTAYVIARTEDGRFEKKIKVTIKEIPVTDINWKQNEYDIAVNEAVDIPYTVTPSNATNAKFIWSSSNPEILRVWYNRFRGLKPGTAYLIVRTEDGKFEKKIKVTIKNVYVTDVKLEKNEYDIAVNQAVDLPYTFTPSNAQNAEFVWSSSNPEILRVWNNRFRGLKQGTAYVIVKTKDGRFEKKIKVTIKNVYVTDVTLEKGEFNIVVNQAMDLPYTVTPSNAQNAEFVWSSSNPDILRVWNNRFRGLKPGTAYVIVKTTDEKFEKKIKVTITK